MPIGGMSVLTISSVLARAEDDTGCDNAERKARSCCHELASTQGHRCELETLSLWNERPRAMPNRSRWLFDMRDVRLSSFSRRSVAQPRHRQHRTAPQVQSNAAAAIKGQNDLTLELTHELSFLSVQYKKNSPRNAEGLRGADESIFAAESTSSYELNGAALGESAKIGGGRRQRAWPSLSASRINDLNRRFLVHPSDLQSQRQVTDDMRQLATAQLGKCGSKQNLWRNFLHKNLLESRFTLTERRQKT